MYVIAEAGSNHNGNLEEAKKLVEHAEKSGASCCKFQFINPETLYLPVKGGGERDGSVCVNPVYEQRNKERLSNAEWADVWTYAKSKNIDVSASIFDEDGAQMLADLGAPFAKIASCDFNNFELIDIAATYFPTVVLSTGMASEEEIEHTVSFLNKSHPKCDYKIMYCMSLYPAQVEHFDFPKLNKIIQLCGIEAVGFSDHTGGVTAAVMAQMLGVGMFEKHFTSSKLQNGFDHAHALDPVELTGYVAALAEVESVRTRMESSNADAVTAIRARRGLYAARDLQPGHIITREDVLVVRPMADLGPADMPSVIGRRVCSALLKHEALGLDGEQVVRGMSLETEANAHWEQELREKGLTDGRS